MYKCFHPVLFLMLKEVAFPRSPCPAFPKAFHVQNIEIPASWTPERNPAAYGQSDEKTEADERLWRETGYGGGEGKEIEVLRGERTAAAEAAGKIGVGIDRRGRKRGRMQTPPSPNMLKWHRSRLWMRKRGVEGEGWAGVSPVSVVAVETPGRAQSIKRGARTEPNGVHLSHERVPLRSEG